MAVTAFSLVRIHNLFAAVMMLGIYSLLAAVLYVVMDAVDVAFKALRGTEHIGYGGCICCLKS